MAAALRSRCLLQIPRQSVHGGPRQSVDTQFGRICVREGPSEGLPPEGSRSRGHEFQRRAYSRVYGGPRQSVDAQFGRICVREGPSKGLPLEGPSGRGRAQPNRGGCLLIGQRLRCDFMNFTSVPHLDQEAAAELNAQDAMDIRARCRNGLHPRRTELPAVP